MTGRRTVDFAMGMAGSMGGDDTMMGGGSGREATMMAFTINGREFGPARTDTPVTVGALEEWTMVNSSPMDHPVHLHVWPMQIIEDGDRYVSEPRWQVVNVPALGQVKVLIAFEDFPGRTVHHCHILDHKDQRMMGIVEAR